MTTIETKKCPKAKTTFAFIQVYDWFEWNNRPHLKNTKTTAIDIFADDYNREGVTFSPTDEVAYIQHIDITYYTENK